MSLWEPFPAGADGCSAPVMVVTINQTTAVIVGCDDAAQYADFALHYDDILTLIITQS